MLSRCLLFALLLCVVPLSHAEDERKYNQCVDAQFEGEIVAPRITNEENNDSCQLSIAFNGCEVDTKSHTNYEKDNMASKSVANSTKFVVGNITVVGIRFGWNKKHQICRFYSNEDVSFHGFHQFAKLIRKCVTLKDLEGKNVNIAEICIETMVESAKHLFEKSGRFYVNKINKLIEDYKRGNTTLTITEKPEEVYDYDYGDADAKIQETTTRNSSKNSLMAVLVVGLVSMAVQ